MRSAYKRLISRATCPANTADCTNELRYFLKYNVNISIITHFKQYVHSFIKSAIITGRVARQANRLYVLRMTVKLAYSFFMAYYLTKHSIRTGGGGGEGLFNLDWLLMTTS